MQVTAMDIKAINILRNANEKLEKHIDTKEI
jgi:hypothetical protein